jgi:hypothetical protein
MLQPFKVSTTSRMIRPFVAAMLVVTATGCVVDTEGPEPDNADPAEYVDDDDDGEPSRAYDRRGPSAPPLLVEPPDALACDDCGADAWCGSDFDGIPMCFEYAGDGDPCGGYAPYGMAPKCGPDLICAFSNGPPDLPGICMAID